MHRNAKLSFIEHKALTMFSNLYKIFECSVLFHFPLNDSHQIGPKKSRCTQMREKLFNKIPSNYVPCNVQPNGI